MLGLALARIVLIYYTTKQTIASTLEICSVTPEHKAIDER